VEESAAAGERGTARALAVTRQRLWQIKRQAEGLCIRCGKPAAQKQDGSGWIARCALCSKRMSQENRRRYRRLNKTARATKGRWR
jgi:hypothetical protein